MKDIFSSAEAAAKTRLTLLTEANSDDAWTMRADKALGPTTRRQLLAQARKCESVIKQCAEDALLELADDLEGA